LKIDDEYQWLISTLAAVVEDVFLDQEGSAWVVIGNDGYYRNVAVKSDEFEDLLIKLSLRAFGEPCKSGTVKKLRRACRGLVSSERRELQYRVARQGESIIIDLGIPSWEAVRVDTSGYEVVSLPSPPFRRSGHEAPLPVPVRGGEVSEILPFLAIENPIDQLLLQVWLPTALVPDILRPFLVFHGPRDSGKTISARLIQNLVDPHTTPDLHMPSKSRDLIVDLQQHYLPVFDNLDKLRGNLADILSHAASNFGAVLRKLYTDDSGKSFRFRRTAIFTALEVPADKPDWLSRCLLIAFKEIPDPQDEEELWNRFNAVHPRILGAMFEALHQALKTYRDLTPIIDPGSGRWRDWNRIGTACALAQGISESDFLAALREAVARQHSQVTDNQPIAKAIFRLMENRSKWEGSPTKLFQELGPIAERERLDRDPAWPRYIATMGKALIAIMPELKAEGIDVTQDLRGKNRDRYYIIRKIATEQEYLKLVEGHQASEE